MEIQVVGIGELVQVQEFSRIAYHLKGKCSVYLESIKKI